MPTGKVREPTARARSTVIRRRRVTAAGVLVAGVLLSMTGFRLAALLVDGAPSSAVPPSARPVPTRPTAPAVAPVATPAATQVAPLVRPTRIPPPVRATGRYVGAPGRTARHGSGRLVTYRVEAEVGTGQSPPAFASAVDTILDNPSSWAGQGGWSVQRVTGRRVDLVIRLATPATVAKVCAAAGLDTDGYTSCRAGRFVMINLDRWLHAIPQYRGDITMYRHYVINHEVGHGLGFGHQACPGRGRPAPVMQQQTVGLKGCLPNGWPYVAGVLASGPAAP